MAFLAKFNQPSLPKSKSITPQWSICIGLLCLTFLTCIACEAPKSPQGYFEPQMLNDEANAGELGSSTPSGDTAMLSYQEKLDGYWVHYSQVSTCVAIGSSLEQINRSLYLIKVEQSEHGGLEETWEACQIDLTPVISVQARVPEALRQSVYPLHTQQGLFVGIPPQQVYHSGAVAEVWGIRFEYPLLDPMPNMTDDERIYDMDEDGEVGVTLYIGDTCLAYMTQRRITHYHGQMIAPDEITGEALSVTEQYIMEASAPICKTAYQTRSNPNRSHFSRIRIDGKGGAINLDQNQDGTIECTELLAQRGQIFPNRMQVMDVDHEACSL